MNELMSKQRHSAFNYFVILLWPLIFEEWENISHPVTVNKDQVTFKAGLNNFVHLWQIGKVEDWWIMYLDIKWSVKTLHSPTAACIENQTG